MMDEAKLAKEMDRRKRPSSQAKQFGLYMTVGDWEDMLDANHIEPEPIPEPEPEPKDEFVTTDVSEEARNKLMKRLEELEEKANKLDKGGNNEGD